MALHRGRAVGMDVDFAQLVRIYGDDRDRPARYRPGRCKGCFGRAIQGALTRRVSTSHVERQNLTMRMRLILLKLPSPIEWVNKRKIRGDRPVRQQEGHPGGSAGGYVPER